MESDPNRWLDEKALGIPHAVAKRYGKCQNDVEEFTSICNLMMVQCCRRFDPNRVPPDRSSFHAYAYYHCAREIRQLKWNISRFPHDRSVAPAIRSRTALLPIFCQTDNPVEDSEDPPASPVEDPKEESELAAWLLQRLEEEESVSKPTILKLRGRRPLSKACRMYYMDGKNLADIAGEFGVSRETARAAVHAGLKWMADIAERGGL